MAGKAKLYNRTVTYYPDLRMETTAEQWAACYVWLRTHPLIHSLTITHPHTLTH